MDKVKSVLSVLTMTEVGAILRISRITAWRLVCAGQIKGFRADKSWQVRAIALDEFME